MAKYWTNLFLARTPKKNDKSPDYVSLWEKEHKTYVKLKIEDKEYDVSAWIKTTKNGKPFLSICLSDEVYTPKAKEETNQEDLPF